MGIEQGIEQQILFKLKSNSAGFFSLWFVFDECLKTNSAPRF